MSLRALPACCLLAATPLAAVEFVDIGLGNQPVAIGAGPRALGMGGAFSAVADDATASTWNPAGLTQCERPELAASGAYYLTRVDASGHRANQDDFRPEHVSGMLPFYAFGCQQVVGVAWQRTYDFTRQVSTATHSVSDDGAGSVVTADSASDASRDGAFATLGVSYAIEPLPGLSIGATVNTWADRWTRSSRFDYASHELAATQIDFSGFIIGTRDTIDIDASTRVLAGTSVTLGTWWQALPELTLALVVKPGFTLDLESDVTSRHTTDDGATIDIVTRSQTTRSTLHQPPMATLGTAWRCNDIDTVSCDATWTRWSQYYYDQAGRRHSPVAFHLDPADFDDLWTLRLGYEHISLLPDMVLVPRCGVVAEWLPAQTRAPSASQADQVSATSDLWLGLTTGLSVCLRSVIWDAGVQVRHGNNVGAGQWAAPDSTADVTVLVARLGVTLQF